MEICQTAFKIQQQSFKSIFSNFKSIEIKGPQSAFQATSIPTTQIKAAYIHTAFHRNNQFPISLMTYET